MRPPPEMGVRCPKQAGSHIIRLLDVICESSRPVSGSPRERVGPILGAGLHARQHKRERARCQTSGERHEF
jgi:hypothetical protein